LKQMANDTGESPNANKQLIADLMAAREVVATGVSAGDAVANCPKDIIVRVAVAGKFDWLTVDDVFTVWYY
jgi:hypothetical protein